MKLVTWKKLRIAYETNITALPQFTYLFQPWAEIGNKELGMEIWNSGLNCRNGPWAGNDNLKLSTCANPILTTLSSR